MINLDCLNGWWLVRLMWTSTRKTFKEKSIHRLAPVGPKWLFGRKINNRNQLKSGWRETCFAKPIKGNGGGICQLALRHFKSVACQKIWNEVHDGCDDNRDEKFHKLHFSVSAALRSLSSMSDCEKSHLFHTNPRPINTFFWHIDYIKLQHFTFFFRSKAISFFLSGEVWIHHTSNNHNNLHVEWLFLHERKYNVCVCWIWQANRHGIRLIHTIVLLDAHETSTRTFHSVTTAGAAMAAVALIVLDACGLSFFVYKSMCICNAHTILIWKENAYGSVCFRLFAGLYLCVNFVELQIVISFHFNLRFRHVLVHTDTDTHSSRKWAHFDVSDTPVLGCTLRTFRQRPAANLWLYAIMIIYYTTNECAQLQQQRSSSSKNGNMALNSPVMHTKHTE